jgi:hypothetical protein
MHTQETANNGKAANSTSHKPKNDPRSRRKKEMKRRRCNRGWNSVRHGMRYSFLPFPLCLQRCRCWNWVYERSKSHVSMTKHRLHEHPFGTAIRDYSKIPSTAVAILPYSK